jgi:hypothetical protein
MGHEVTEATRAKLSEIGKILQRDPERKSKQRSGLKNWWANLSEDKRRSVLGNLAEGRTKTGPRSAEHNRKIGEAKRKAWVSKTPEEKEIWQGGMRSWYQALSPEEKSEWQRKKTIKRWARPEAHVVVPQKDGHKHAIKSSMKSFWASKTSEERRAIALSNWEKRRNKNDASRSNTGSVASRFGRFH